MYLLKSLGFLFVDALPETKSSHLNQWGWKMSFLLGFGLFSGAKMLVSGVELKRPWQSKGPNPPKATPPSRNKTLISLIKGNQWLIRPYLLGG